jgi:hypothetical protein
VPTDLQPANLEYIKLGVSFLSEGFLGSVLTNAVTVFRNRVQPVRYRIKTTPLFTEGVQSTTIEAKVTLMEAGKDYRFDNLFLSELTVTNTGNQNIKEFTVGITMDDSAQMVHVSCDPPDRHHGATVVNAPSPAQPRKDVDYVLKPFNRRDPYSFRILSTCFQDEEPGKIMLSSSEAVRFVSTQGLIESLDTIDVRYPGIASAIRLVAKITVPKI